MKDQAYLEEAKRNELDVRPMTGAAVEALVTELYATPPEIVALARESIKQESK
jgi:hypothetical protein